VYEYCKNVHDAYRSQASFSALTGYSCGGCAADHADAGSMQQCHRASARAGYWDIREVWVTCLTGWIKHVLFCPYTTYSLLSVSW